MTSPPDWVTAVPSNPAIHNEPARNYQWDALSQNQISMLRERLMTTIVQVVVQGLTGSFVPGGGLEGALDQLQDWVSDIPIVGDLLSSIIDGLGGLLDIDFSSPEAFFESIAALVAQMPLNALNLFGTIPSSILGLIPMSNIGNNQPNLLTAPTFDVSGNIEGAGIWTWDGAVGRTSPGSVKVTANGADLRLVSNAIPVTQDQQLSIEAWVMWSGLSFTGTPLRLQVTRYLNHANVGTDNLAAPVAPGTNQATWLQLSNSYTVPAGCDEIRVQFLTTATATAGTIHWDDADAHKTGLLAMDWVDQLPETFQAFIDTIWQSISGLSGVGNLLTDLFDVLQHIPFLNVLGIGGPANIGATAQATWDQLISGLVGELDIGAGLADLFNIGQDVSSRATLGQYSWDILGIRNNKTVDSGFLASSEANFAYSKVMLQSTAPTIAVTQSVSAMSFLRVRENVNKTIIKWHGAFTGSITDFRIVLWQMDPATGGISVVHTSSNQIGALSSTTGAETYYTIPSGGRDVLAGEIYGVEFCVVGSGTYNLVGQTSWMGNNSSTFPRRWAATRNSGTTFPPSSPIADGSITYSGNVGWFEFAKELGVPATPHSVEPRQFSTAGSTTTPIPSWCNYIDVVVLGAGGGSGTSGFTDYGDGGHAGSWNAVTLTRGSTIPTGTTTLSVIVGAGGAAGDWIGDGGAGGASTVSATGMTTLTAAGGAGGTANGGGRYGLSPGNYTFNSVVYNGGGQQNTLAQPGIAPGGGGSAPTTGNQDGQVGAPGAVWLKFRQT